MSEWLWVMAVGAAFGGGVWAGGRWWSLKFAMALEQGRSPAARAMRAAALTLSSENDR